MASFPMVNYRDPNNKKKMMKFANSVVDCSLKSELDLARLVGKLGLQSN